jgi:hypothetical protein
MQAKGMRAYKEELALDSVIYLVELVSATQKCQACIRLEWLASSQFGVVGHFVSRTAQGVQTFPSLPLQLDELSYVYINDLKG